ncbi:hypothetical protein [Streptomyces monashensis]|uniref:hypothetical protein n=1 Tax=Streptomyces monashensis TaxID=1678012 RepID=UPI001FE70B40|nr:hypothetical protein [Streptomyces monashensis]
MAQPAGHQLGDEERITVCPSLGAGNDPSRPYDLETDQRIAEFKLARWRGADAMRKRQTFNDLVMLAADTSGRRAELFVIGPEPCRFLTTSTSTAAWALDRTPGALRTFTTVFGASVTGASLCGRAAAASDSRRRRLGARPVRAVRDDLQSRV